MGLRKKKSDTSQNQAWLDWLNDDSPGQQDTPDPAQGRAPSFNGSAKKPSTVGLDGFTARARAGFPQSQQPRFTTVEPKPPSKPKSMQRPARSAAPTLNWRATHSPPKQGKVDKSTDQGDIAINIHLPQITLPKLKKLLPDWRYMRWAILAFVVIALLAGGNVWLRKTNEAARLAKQSGSEQPSYAPLKPSTSDKSSVDASSVYNAKQQLYKYNDTYLGASLTISQQPLPDDIKQNPDKLAKIAEQSIGATDSFDTANGKVYIATSEGGYQRLVLVHRQLLVFITSPKELEITDWVSYIQSLE